MSERKFNLEPLLELQTLSKDAAVARFKIEPGDIEKGVEYGKLKKLELLNNDETEPTELYFRGGKLRLAYVGRTALADGNKAALFEALGETEHKLRSGAGKGATLYVYPEKGVAFSATGQRLDFLEVFPPCSFKDYESEVYEEPPRFIR